MTRMLRAKEVVKTLGISMATLYRWKKEGTFPKPMRLGPNSVAWREDMVLDWLDRQQMPTAPAAAKAVD